MLYVASLSVPAKKAFPDKVQLSAVNRITSLMSQDPAVSDMDVVLFGPKDAVGPKGRKLQSFIDSAHPELCIIYMYTKSVEEEYIDTPNKFQCKKITPDTVKEAVTQFYKEHAIQTGKATVSSNDFVAPDSDLIGDVFEDEDDSMMPVFIRPTVTPSDINNDTEEGTSGGFINPMEDLSSGDTSAVSPVEEELGLGEDTYAGPTLPKEPLIANDDSAVQDTTIQAPVQTVEESLGNLSSGDDWDLYLKSLQRESIVKRLIQENSEFQGLVRMLDVLDSEIEAVWLDSSLSSEQKFDKIKDIGLKRSACMASLNSINSEKVISIITRITQSAKCVVESELEQYTAAISTIVSAKKELANTDNIAKVMEQRADIQFRMLQLSRKVIDLYKSIDDLVTEQISSLDKKLPSSNDFINNYVKPVGTKIFTPQNTAELATKLMKALQENRTTASIMEADVNSFINLMFEMFEKDREAIDYLQRKIALLKANKIEDVLIVDSVIKNCLRIWTGADGTGRSATAITYCGMLSRRHNTLLIDLTGKAKFMSYGIKSISLDEFMHNRIEKRFLCVQSSAPLLPDELQNMVDEIKTRLNYYAFVNIIVDPADTSALNQLSTDALISFFVCNCTSTSLDVMREVISKHTYGNIARRLVLIDPPVSPLTIIDQLNIDPSLFATTILPNIPDMRACAIRHDRPYEYEMIIRIFEEAFR